LLWSTQQVARLIALAGSIVSRASFRRIGDSESLCLISVLRPYGIMAHYVCDNLAVARTLINRRDSMSRVDRFRTTLYVIASAITIVEALRHLL
jgi:hypothetical protein